MLFVLFSINCVHQVPPTPWRVAYEHCIYVHLTDVIWALCLRHPNKVHSLHGFGWEWDENCSHWKTPGANRPVVETTVMLCQTLEPWRYFAEKSPRVYVHKILNCNEYIWCECNERQSGAENKYRSQIIQMWFSSAVGFVGCFILLQRRFADCN